MRRTTFIFLGLALVLASGGAALASTVTVTLTSAGGVVSNDGSVFVGPYTLQVGSYPAPNHPVTISASCDDYSDEISVGESWQANEVSLTPAGVSSALFGSQPNADHLYLEAAYLTSLLGKAPTSDYNDISYAIWGLFEPAALASSNYDTGATAFLTQAQNAQLNFSEFSGWQILTPINGSQSGGGRPQEFLVPAGNPTPTPEPATLALLGSGLLAVGLTLRNKRTSSPSA